MKCNNFAFNFSAIQDVTECNILHVETVEVEGGGLFSICDFSCEVCGTFPMNSYKNFPGPMRSYIVKNNDISTVQWLARSFSTYRHTYTFCYFYVRIVLSLNIPEA